MRTLHVGDIVRNTNTNWFGHKRVLVTDEGHRYIFRVLDGQYAGRASYTRRTTAERLFNNGEWTMDYPDHIVLPQGA